MNKQEKRNLESKPKRQKITEGSILEIPIDNKYFVYAQILSKGGYAFFDYKTQIPLHDFSVLQNVPILFVIGVYDYVVTKCIWHKVGKLPIKEELKIQPMQYIYHSHSNKFEIYDNNTGKVSPATKEQVRGLERCAVWAENHVKDRIRDYYDNVPCIWLKEHYTLFPESTPKQKLGTVPMSGF